MHEPNEELLRESTTGNSKMVEFILQNCNGVDINSEDSFGNTPLIKASQNGNYDVVNLLLDKDGIDINHGMNNNGYGSDGLTALYWASFNGYVDIVSSLLQQEDIDVNRVQHGGWNALIAASQRGHAQVVQLLLKEGDLDVNKPDKKGRTALYFASSNGHTEVVQLLLNIEGVVINRGDRLGKRKTALYWASYKGHVGVVKLLLERREIALNTEYDDTKRTALWIAFERGHSEIAQTLIEHPRVNIKKGLYSYEDVSEKLTKLIFNHDIANCTETCKLFIATILGNATQVSILLEKDVTPINSIDNLSRTPLYWASSRGHLNIVQDLIVNPRIDVNRKTFNNDANALQQASKNGHLQIVQLLRNHPKIEVNIPTLNRETPLMAATINGHSQVVEELLSATNIDVNYATFNGKTALIFAVSLKHPSISKLLLRCPKTDTSLMDQEYRTALDIAKERNMSNIIHAFEIRGNLQINKGHTCCSNSINQGIHIAVRNRDWKWIHKFLVCPDIDINMHNKDGQTPLNLAVHRGLNKIVDEFLIDPRINVNKPNVRGKQNALLIASEMGHVNIFKKILRHNQTDVNQLNANRKSALQVALQKYEYGDDEKRDTNIIKESKYFRIIKLLLRCSKTELKIHLNNWANTEWEPDDDMQQVIDLRNSSMHFSPTCCLDVIDSLMDSAWVGDFRAIKGLLDCPGSEINVNKVDNKGRTPLYRAAMRGHSEAVETLIKDHDVDVNIGKRVNGGTAFSIASEKSHFDVMKALILNEESILGEGWCIDNWTSPCKKVNDLTEDSQVPASSMQSSKFN